MKHFAHLTLAAALLTFGCGSDDATNYLGNPGLPPVAVADSFSVIGNGILTGTLTANDTPNGGIVTSFQSPTTLGGTVSVNAVGQFTYTAPLNQSNVSDTFTYTLGNSVGNSSATVTIQLGARGLFVKNDVATSGNGSQASPFKTLAEAVTAAAGINGAQIVVFRGDGSNTGLNTPVALGANQGIASFDAASPANITGPVNLSSGNAVRNLRIAGGPGDAVSGTAASNATLSGLQIEASSGNGVTLVNCTGTVTVSNSTFRNLPGIGVFAPSDTGNLTWAVSNSSFANVTNRGINTVTFLAASHNVTVNNCTASQGGTGEFFAIDALGSGSTGATVSNCNVDGSSTRPRGIGVLADSTSQVVVLLTANNVTAFTSEGVLLIAGKSTNLKSRLTGNVLNGNILNGSAANQGFSAVSTSTASLGLIFQNNVGQVFSILNTGTSTLAVESLDQFNTASNNTATLVRTGPITNAPAGSLNIP